MEMVYMLPSRHLLAAVCSSSVSMKSLSESQVPAAAATGRHLSLSRSPKWRQMADSCFCCFSPTAQDHTPSQLQARTQYTFAIGANVIPHPDKVEKGGEDAYFVSQHNGCVFAIADGVSGWAEENVDPALYSKELMKHAAALACTDEEVQNNPRLLLKKAHFATRSIGAATAIVAILEPKGILHIANLGDCGLRLIRHGHIVFATSPQQHYFDCPFQFSSANGGQQAEDAVVHEISVMECDTVVMGSDGLFDNVYGSEIIATVAMFGGADQAAAEHTASALAALASKNARNKKYESPYSQEAISQGYDLPFWKKILGKKLTGGKLDDITVLVGHVVDVKSLPRHGTSELLCYGTHEIQKHQ
ncbi:hypothetical protein O6H91_01G054800 [Diphasiastrum complanatum]|uniref:Uncharacterized protein n=1 Tax=Diphasiastrum complanatum TaxID=34168 RepID=A0ACC2ER19_DIPCM|nr:hypothetical protein O6H91_01G054800 [Diphasiastrum complanatum]